MARDFLDHSTADPAQTRCRPSLPLLLLPGPSLNSGQSPSGTPAGRVLWTLQEHKTAARQPDADPSTNSHAPWRRTRGHPGRASLLLGVAHLRDGEKRESRTLAQRRLCWGRPVSVPAGVAGTGHVWLGTPDVAAPQRPRPIYNPVPLSPGSCTSLRPGCREAVPRAGAACAGRTPALLWVGNRPLSARVPKAVGWGTPAPFTDGCERLPEGRWRLRGGPPGDPGTQRQLTLKLPPPAPTGLPGGSGPASPTVAGAGH